MERPSPSLDRVAELLRLASTPGRRFPPTELYSEGWMLRLVLDAAERGVATLPFPWVDGSRWYSEARIASPFMARFRGDRGAEGYTHADGVVGHFAMVDGTES